MEGANVGQDHNNTDFFDHFGADYQGAGSQNVISSLNGEDDTFAVDTSFPYPTGDCNYGIDQLGAGEGEIFISSQDGIGRAVMYDAADWRTIVCSPVLGAFEEDEFFDTRQYLMMEYVAFLADIDGPELQTSASGLEFESAYPGYDVSESLFLENTGFLDLEIWEIEVSSNDFLVDTLAPLTIAGREFIELNVTFRAMEEGSYSGYITILCNDRDNQSTVISLTAFCLNPPDIDVSESVINLELNTDIQHQYPLTISNEGGSDLEYELITSELITWLNISPSAGIIPAADSEEIIFNFDTSDMASGTYTTEINIISNDPDETELILPVSLTIVITENNQSDLPQITALQSVYPNPFNPVTNFHYTLTQPDQVKLEIYNLRGQLVEQLVNTFQPADSYNISWQADNTASGIYFYRFTAGLCRESGKLILLK